jgi:PAS domain S-box-containing protein
MSGQSRLSGDEARSRLYDVMRADGKTEERIRHALELGTEYFGVEHGYVARIDQATDDWEVYISIDPDGETVHEGLSVDFSTTYCRRTIEQEEVVTFPDGPDEALAADPDFRTYGFHCYHGAPVIVNGEPFGTVCFASTEARAAAFSDAEKAFTDLVAQMIGNEIERERRQEQLERREREVEERAEIQRAVIDASFDLVFRFDTDGTYVYHSAGSESVLGYSPEEFIGEPYTFVLPTDEARQRAESILERVLDGETIEETYLPLETAGGDVIYVDIRVTPVYEASVPTDERGPEDVVAVQGMAHDATERRRRAQLNSVLNRVLRHNLRNDVGVMKGYAETLSDRLAGGDRDLADRIQGTADKLLELGDTARRLEDHMEYSPEVTEMDVVSLVADATDRLRDQHPVAAVSTDLPDEAIAETGPQLRTALWELLDNAARHAGEEPAIEVCVTASEQWVTITVADDGPGLPADERAVFDSGEETPLVHGSGLGLWLVRSVVTSLDGEVSVADDAGTVLEVVVPNAGR